MTTSALPTVLVLGDQLNRDIASLRDARPGSQRILMVENRHLLDSQNWHRQRRHLVLSAMRHFAAELRNAGFEVDHRRAASFREALRDHRNEFEVERVVVMEPADRAGTDLLHRLEVDIVPNDQFLCDRATFAAWAETQGRLTMEHFYRWQRRRLDILVDGDEPVGGRWNFDHDNREPPPRDGRAWPTVDRSDLDDIDRELVEEYPDGWGAPPDGTWPVTREQALRRLDGFVTDGLEPFGSHEDAMLRDEWKLAHSALSSSLNLGLLRPREVVDAAVAAFEGGRAPINSVEGFIRQVIGWREYVYGVYWLWGETYRGENALAADRPLPPVFTGRAPTDMACVSTVLDRVARHGYTHHIERLMVLGNLALTAGIRPTAMIDWMRAGFVDGADWVMVPNVVGMALHADGGRMATKPYASGGAYINRMSDFCSGCRFDPRRRVGPDACPFTTLYWDFLARNEERLAGNHRMARQLANLRRLGDLDEVRARAAEVLAALDDGDL